jgi:hypothetical protein
MVVLILHQNVKSIFMLIGRFQTSGSKPGIRFKSLNKGFKILQNIPNIPQNMAGIFSSPCLCGNNIRALPTFCLFVGP